MRNKLIRNLVSSIFTTILTLSVFVVVSFAWFVPMYSRKFAYITVGDLESSVYIGDPSDGGDYFHQINDPGNPYVPILLHKLVYIDLEQEISDVNFRAATNAVAVSFYIKMEVPSTSTNPVRLIISQNWSFSHLFLVADVAPLDGSLQPIHNADPYTILRSYYPAPPITNLYQQVKNNVINDLSTNSKYVVEPGETLIVEVYVWGDYNRLPFSQKIPTHDPLHNGNYVPVDIIKTLSLTLTIEQGRKN